MRTRPNLLDDLIRWGLRARVAAEVPSPRVWERIEARLHAGETRTAFPGRAPWWNSGPAAQAVLLVARSAERDQPWSLVLWPAFCCSLRSLY